MRIRLNGVWRPFQAVIFDLDGLVLDSEPTYRRAWCEAAARLGFALPETLSLSFSGQHYAAIEARLLEAYGSDFPLSAFRAVSAECWRARVEREGIAVKPGFFRLLKRLSAGGQPVCLATNSHTANARECLRRAGIEGCFEHIVCADQVARGKPAPDLFLEAARRLGLASADCLVLEDSPPGIEAARRAGAMALMIPDSSAPRLPVSSLAEHCFASLEEVADRLQVSPIGA